MRVPILMFLTLLLSSCLDLGNALFLPLLKSLKRGNYGGYAPSYGGYGPSYGGFGYGYNTPHYYGHGHGHGHSHGGGHGHGHSHGGGHGHGHGHHHSHHSGHRTGRTYSDIARVINPDPYIGGGRFSPRAPFAPLGR